MMVPSSRRDETDEREEAGMTKRGYRRAEQRLMHMCMRRFLSCREKEM